jgi:hypothetical protein
MIEDFHRRDTQDRQQIASDKHLAALQNEVFRTKKVMGEVSLTKTVKKKSLLEEILRMGSSQGKCDKIDGCRGRIWSLRRVGSAYYRSAQFLTPWKHLSEERSGTPEL